MKIYKSAAYLIVAIALLIMSGSTTIFAKYMEPTSENFFMPLMIVPDERTLDVSSADTTESSVDSYVSFCTYGPTQQFFNFGPENAVMTVLFSHHDPNFEPQISIEIFSSDVDGDQIQEWIDLHFTDVGVPDIDPIYTRTLDPSEYSIINTEFIEHEVAEPSPDGYGDEYDNYRVQYSIADITIDGRFQLTGFSSETVVHIATAGCDW